MGDYDKDKQKIQQYTENIIKMENSYDGSMEGVMLDRLVTEYILTKSRTTVDWFNQIMEQQTEETADYGDIDFTVTKLKVTNRPRKRKYEKTGGNWSGFQCICNCGGTGFVLFVKESDAKYMTDREYYIYDCVEEVDVIDYSKFVTYGDFRDEKYVIAISHQQILNKDDKWIDLDYNIIEAFGKGGLRMYNKFKDAHRDLSSVVYCLNNPDE